MQARYYDPVIGRFYSNDPIGMTDVHSFNRYAYANNNPYKYTDPDGRAVRVAITVANVAKSTYRSIPVVLRAIGILKPKPVNTENSGNVGTGVNPDVPDGSAAAGGSGKNKGKKGTGFRGGKKKDRDNTKGNTNGDFGDQIHGEKLPGDSDFTPEEIEEEIKEFKKRDKPGRREREKERRENRKRKRDQ